MSVQRLGPKKIRLIQRAIGDAGTVFRGWANGGYTLWFVTTDHRHGSYNLKTQTWDLSGGGCLTSCHDFDNPWMKVSNKDGL